MPVRPIPVQDPDDPRLVDFRHLSDADLRRDRPGPTSPDGRFIVEGHLAVQQLLRSAYPVVAMLVAEQQWHRVAPLVDKADRTQFPCYVAPQQVVNTTVGFRLHRGVVASAARLSLLDPFELVRDARLMVVLEGTNDHENLGGLFRNAAAFGVDAVLLDPTCADPLYRRSVRVSLGHVLRVPFARFTRDTWPDALGGLAERGVTTLALTPAPHATELDELTGAQFGRVAVLLGAEGPGLSAAALDAAALHVRIPLAPGTDSLNVSVAAAIALHHLASTTPR